MRDNPELDSSSAIDYIQNRQHFTVIQVFILSLLFFPSSPPFFLFFFWSMKKCVWLFGCLPEAASNTLTTVILPDMSPLKTVPPPPLLSLSFFYFLFSSNVQKLLGSADRHPNSLSVSHPSSAPSSATSDSVVLGHFELTIFTGDTADINKAGQHISISSHGKKKKSTPPAGLCTVLTQ